MAPSGPAVIPASMFAARVAAMPALSIHQASTGAGSRWRAASSSTMEAATISPSITTGYRRLIMPVSPWAVTTSTACR
jgi:hypothetical protein